MARFVPDVDRQASLFAEWANRVYDGGDDEQMYDVVVGALALWRRGALDGYIGEHVGLVSLNGCFTVMAHGDKADVKRMAAGSDRQVMVFKMYAKREPVDTSNR